MDNEAVTQGATVMDEAEVARVAAGLTSGQRAVLLETERGKPRLYEAAPGIPRVKLFAKGLLSSHGSIAELPLFFTITPLGLAVRARLMQGEG